MLIRTVTLKLFKPGNKSATVQRVVAGPGRQFSAANIEEILCKFSDQVEAAMPGKYRMVAVGPATFNFVRTDS